MMESTQHLYCMLILFQKLPDIPIHQKPIYMHSYSFPHSLCEYYSRWHFLISDVLRYPLPVSQFPPARHHYISKIILYLYFKNNFLKSIIEGSKHVYIFVLTLLIVTGLFQFNNILHDNINECKQQDIS